MYSETVDFKEKYDALRRMIEAIRSVAGGSWRLENCNIALEIGGSGGVLAGIVSSAGPRVICTDVVDTLIKYEGQFPRLLKEKFARQGLQLDLGQIEFHKMDAQALIYGANKFDLVFSLNAFEHIPDPLQALKEAYRVLRPGGVFYASFDPVWTADSGSHFIHYGNQPWLHLLLDDDEFCDLMRAAGATDPELNEYRSGMNRLPASYYETQLKLVGCEIFDLFTMRSWSGCVCSANEGHINRRRAAINCGIDENELMIRGYELTAIK